MGRPRATTAEAAAAAYRELAPAVLGYLRSQRVPDAEDVLGDVFVHVARDLGRFRGDDDDLRRWVFTIAHHRAVDTWRRRRVRPRIADVPVPEIVDGTATVDVVDPGLVAALHRLTPDQRAVVLLRFVADLSLEDTAGVMRRRVGAVKALQHRALAALEAALAVSDAIER